MLGHKRGEPQFLVSAEPRSDHGVKNIPRGKPPSAMQHAQIIICTVENQSLSRKHFVERLEREFSERIDKQVLVLGANLD